MNKILDFLIITLVFAIVLSVFFFQNNHEIIFKFINEYAMSLGYLVAGFSIFSFSLGLVYAIRSWNKDRREKKELKSHIYDLEKQIDGMKLSLETLSNNMISTKADGKTINSAIAEGSNIVADRNQIVSSSKTDSGLVNDILGELKSNQ